MLSLIKANKAVVSQVSLVWNGLSLRKLKLILVGILSGYLVLVLFLWQPAFAEFCSLKEEKRYWQQVTKMGAETPATVIPSMDQLPNLIDQCCDVFIKAGVDVASFNVERFGERSSISEGTRIDYALVRLRLLGQWQGILSSLKELEDAQGLRIQVQEVLLAKEGGTILLQIYYKTGDG